MVDYIDLNKVIGYSLDNCFPRSQSKCAEYVKNAFAAGGCTYICGNGWDNQNFCRENGFKCIGDFVPMDNNPRPHGNMQIQLPDGYVQQPGDICLIKHGKYGHIVYAAGTGLNDWVSDFWQRPPGQSDSMGPYCYADCSYERVQFWRHSSMMSGASEVATYVSPIIADAVSNAKSSDSVEMKEKDYTPKVKNRVFGLSSSSKSEKKLWNEDESKKTKYSTLLERLKTDTSLGNHDILEISSDDFTSTSILKGDQESKKVMV